MENLIKNYFAVRPEIENSTNAIIFNVIYMKQKESLNSEVDSAFSLGKIKRRFCLKYVKVCLKVFLVFLS